jgi:hypothetical protein
MKTQVQRIAIITQVAIAGFGLMILSACASLPIEEIREEPGYYYGMGSGTSADVAESEAKKDLITKALARSRESAGITARVNVTDEVVESFKIPSLKVFARSKVDGVTKIVYRIKESEWNTYQADREKAANVEILSRVVALSPESGRTLSERLLEGASLLDRLNREALADVLRQNGPGTPLVASIIEKTCVDQMTGLGVRMDVKRGFVGKDTVFSGRIVDAAGRILGSTPVHVEWTVRSGESYKDNLKSASDGTFTIKFPEDKAFHNHSVRLVVSTGFSDNAYGSSVLRDADAKTKGEYSYQFFDDVKKYFSAEALVPGGTFLVGALDRDLRATKREAPRKATVKDFYIDTYLVTNTLYEMFLNDTQSTSTPEYWDNTEYNQDYQPVIGVSQDDAVKFAAWLSEQLGVKYRLPSEAEWERAARGGRDVIYPWGDQSPDDGVLANYNGNGKYTGPSPVDSFTEGKNAYGLYDMAGNVWQWTSTPREAGKSSGAMIVKGGSWMDGPVDLRISNRRDLDPRSGYVDVGIRLVREVEK